MLEVHGWQWKQDVLDIGAGHLEIAKSHASLLKWQFARWLSLMLAIFATRIWA